MLVNLLITNLCFLLQLDLKYHSFFSPINWEDLMSKKITPPFIPSVVSSNLWLPRMAFCHILGLGSYGFPAAPCDVVNLSENN